MDQCGHLLSAKNWIFIYFHFHIYCNKKQRFGVDPLFPVVKFLLCQCRNVHTTVQSDGIGQHL